MGELIVGLQIVGTDIQRLSLGWLLRSMLAPVKERWFRRNATEKARGVFRSRVSRMARHNGYAVEVQQRQQLGGLTGSRFACERPLQ